MRRLGISNLEDKLVQKMIHQVLESVYEPLFLDCSFGFRPKRSAHDAINALSNHLYRQPVSLVIDVDLATYFDRIDHNILESMLRKKIKDPRFMRYIKRLLKAGVLAEGELRVSDQGVVQGSSCSPILANIYAHYVIDQWFEQVVKPHCHGQVALFRYADDLVICCEHDRDGERIEKALRGRLAKFGLALNEDKTQRVKFSKRAMAAGHRQGTFDFLSFSVYWGRSRRGYVVPKVKTSGKRLRRKLKRVSDWVRTHRNRFPQRELWRQFCIKLQGHVQYFGVSDNVPWVGHFIHAAVRILFKWLNRRSQRKSYTWAQFSSFLQAFPPPRARVVHSLYGSS